MAISSTGSTERGSRLHALAVAAALLALSAESAVEAGGAPAACAPHEEVVFSCRTGPGAKVVAVCGASGWSAGSGYLQYRFGAPGRIELALPRNTETPPSASATSRVLTYSGGGGATLRFKRGATDYTVYSAISSKWGEKAGVVAERGGKRVMSGACKGAVVSKLGPELFSRGGFAQDETAFSLPR